MEQEEEKKVLAQQMDESYWRWLGRFLKSLVSWITYSTVILLVGFGILITGLILSPLGLEGDDWWILGITVPLSFFLITYGLWRMEK